MYNDNFRLLFISRMILRCVDIYFFPTKSTEPINKYKNTSLLNKETKKLLTSSNLTTNILSPITSSIVSNLNQPILLYFFSSFEKSAFFAFSSLIKPNKPYKSISNPSRLKKYLFLLDTQYVSDDPLAQAILSDSL